MSELKFTDDHEWILLDGNVATVGITKYAQEQMGDVVFVETPAVGSTLEKGGDAAVVESVKAASDVFAPISGEVTEANDALTDAPDKVNSDPLGDGWLFKMTVANAADLEGMMDQAAYDAYVAGLE